MHVGIFLILKLSLPQKLTPGRYPVHKNQDHCNSYVSGEKITIK